MKNAILILLVAAAGAVSAGCATKPVATVESYTHTPYVPAAPIVDKVVLNKRFDQAWNELVENLAANFFAVDQIDKESRFISINASQDAGGIGRDRNWWLAYASCGESERRFAYDGREYSYAYPTLGADTYNTVYGDHVQFWAEVRPRVEAEIKMNIYLSPLDAGRTEMSVNARYKFTRYVDQDIYTYRNNGQYLFAQTVDDRSGSAITFTTRNAGQHPSDQTPPIMCYATGRFESAVIDLVQQPR
ncbi:MAG TPA: hypothetical protein PKK10_12975 [Woeseiaceae bacterium]|nr:hypothetical protein [Woeseiaceae bacterium]